MKKSSQQLRFCLELEAESPKKESLLVLLVRAVIPVGGFIFYVSSLLGEMIQFD